MAMFAVLLDVFASDLGVGIISDLWSRQPLRVLGSMRGHVTQSYVSWHCRTCSTYDRAHRLCGSMCEVCYGHSVSFLRVRVPLTMLVI